MWQRNFVWVCGVRDCFEDCHFDYLVNEASNCIRHHWTVSMNRWWFKRSNWYVHERGLEKCQKLAVCALYGQLFCCACPSMFSSWLQCPWTSMSMQGSTACVEEFLIYDKSRLFWQKLWSAWSTTKLKLFIFLNKKFKFFFRTKSIFLSEKPPILLKIRSTQHN